MDRCESARLCIESDDLDSVGGSVCVVSQRLMIIGVAADEQGLEHDDSENTAESLF